MICERFDILSTSETVPGCGACGEGKASDMGEMFHYTLNYSLY